MTELTKPSVLDINDTDSILKQAESIIDENCLIVRESRTKVSQSKRLMDTINLAKVYAHETGIYDPLLSIIDPYNKEVSPEKIIIPEDFVCKYKTNISDYKPKHRVITENDQNKLKAG